ncbi:MAG: hypothetical protein WC708_06255 [Lentisphaeria bacterium]
MILFRCSCGDTFKVDDTLAGGTGECESCHREFTIPAQSDPDVVLVFKAGSEGDGTPMLKSELENKLASQEFDGADLIWTDDHWTPISDWQAGAAAPPAAPAAPAHVRPTLRIRAVGGGETETEPPPFPADDGEAGADGEEQPVAARGVMRQAMGLERYTPPPPAAKPRKAWWKLAVRLILLVVALAAGYKYGGGPILANYLKKPSYVIIHNGDAVQYQATLGWRRLSQELPAGASCHFQVFVGMDETQTLRLTPAGGGAETLIKVPVKMGKNILVNPGRKTVYRVVDLPWLAQQRAAEQTAAFAQAMAANRAPQEGLALMEKLDQLSREVVKQNLQDELTDPAPYDLDEMTDDGAATAPGAAAGKPRLTCSPLIQAPFADGQFTLNFSESQAATLDASVRLPAFSATLPPNITVKIPEGASLQVNRLAKRLRFALRQEKQTLDLPKGSFTGTWEYSATWPFEVTPPAVQEWKWQWIFRGQGTFKGEKKNVTCIWTKDAAPIVDLQPAK